MRSITNLYFCALAASNAVQGHDVHTRQTDDAEILSDINVISRYWGALHKFYKITCYTANPYP